MSFKTPFCGLSFKGKYLDFNLCLEIGSLVDFYIDFFPISMSFNAFLMSFQNLEVLLSSRTLKVGELTAAFLFLYQCT